MACIDKCRLNNNRISLTMLSDKRNNNTTIKTLEAMREGINYRLEYAPVGNFIQEPTIILCGITPGNDTWEKFLDSIRSGENIEKAAFKSIYSNMRPNMFDCLDEIGLFDYLAGFYNYWHQVRKSKAIKQYYWNKIFEDEAASMECGIQLTQACNCAILRNSDSKQPSQKAINEIRENEPNCLFNRFQITNFLKLIIFWGTTLNLEKYWKESCYYNSSIKTLSLPHPSSSNRVFNNRDLFKPLSDQDSTQLRNAKHRLKKGKEIINEL